MQRTRPGDIEVPAGPNWSGIASGSSAGQDDGAAANIDSQSGRARASRRKVSHITRACLQCRRRKIRCDGNQPDCSACATVGQICQYSTAEDGRKAGAIQRSKVAAARRAQEDDGDFAALRRKNTMLRNRLIALEKALQKRGVSVSEALEEAHDLLGSEMLAEDDDIGMNRADNDNGYIRSNSEASAEADVASSGTEGVVPDFDRLHLDDQQSSTLCHYGPTSALTHLSSADPSLQSPLSIDRPSRDGRQSEAPAVPHNFGFGPTASFPWLQPRQDIDWSRNLPDLGISRDTHDALIELCEAFFTPWCWVVNFFTFKRDMQLCLGPSINGQAPPTRTPFYSPLLHNIVLAMGACMWRGDRISRPFPPINEKAVPACTFSRDEADMAGDAFGAKAKECFDVECERPMQSTVNGLLLLASFNSGRARPNLGHVLFTAAVATSHTLGVNIDCAKLVNKGIISQETKAHRDQLFWTVYIQDKLWSMAIGRFTYISPDDHDVTLPEINPQYDELPWIAPRVWRDIEAPGLALAHNRPAYISTCYHASIRLSLIQNAILRKFYALKAEASTRPHIPTVEAFQRELADWQKSLPQTIRLDASAVPPPHVLTLHITFNYTVIILTRPLYQRMIHTNPQHAAVQACDAAALKVVELLGLYDRFYSLNHAPLSSLQSTFVSGTIHCLKGLEAARRQDARVLESALQGAAICIASLHKASLSWRTAGRISKILQSLFNEWLPGAIRYMQHRGWVGEHAFDTSAANLQGPVTSLLSVAQHPSLKVPEESPSSQSSYYGDRASSNASSMPISKPIPVGISAVNMNNSGGTIMDHTPYGQSLGSISSFINSDIGNLPASHTFAISPDGGPSPPNNATWSNDYLYQLLNQPPMQSPSQANDLNSTGSIYTSMFSDPNQPIFQPSSGPGLLSSFDFSVEAFNDMLKSAAESEL